jgi:NAD(P)-dependent dehydrogenase (short-subunit alcohol dehydrogenase family)
MATDFVVEHPDLRGSVAVVTGGGRGLGRDFAIDLAKSGANVVITGRDVDALRATARQIGNAGGLCSTFVADVTDRAAVEAAAAQIMSTVGVPALLVNNAGRLDAGAFLDADPDTWWRVLEVNIRGVFNWTQVVVPRMATLDRGCVINITSTAASNGPPTTTSYNISKAAVTNLTATLAIEFPEHVVVFALAPFGLTDMTRYLLTDDKVDSSIVRGLHGLLGGRPEGILPQTLAMFRFLISGEADHLSGRHVETFDSIDELRAEANKPTTV